jgi:alpha-mannosidase
VHAEKLAAMASALRAAPFPGAALERAWEQVLWMQHHDAWNSRRWHARVAAQAQEAGEICDAAAGAAAEALAEAPPGNARALRVINTLGHDREDLVEARMTFDPGAAGVRVIDGTGREIPAQLSPLRRYHRIDELRQAAREARVFGWSYRGPANGGVSAATVVFRARVPAAGYSTYRVEALKEENPRSPINVRRGARVTVETSLYQVEFDPARGGAVTSLVSKQTGKEFCVPSGERLFNEYRGYFIEEERWRSSAEAPASIEVLESGPVRSRIAITGKTGGCPFRTVASFVEGQRRIDFHTTFRFEKDTWIGDPWDMGAERARDEPRRSHYDTRWSLQAYFPVALQGMTIDKNCAFDVCRSALADTFYQRFDQIKHNVIVNWVDLADRAAQHGLAVLCDRTTAYTHGPGHPFALVMAWGWRGGYWWGKVPLRGEQSMHYAILPHAGGWSQAGLWGENDRWMEPLAAQAMPGPAAAGDERRSLVTLSGEGYHISSMFVRDGALYLRLFNAEGGPSPHRVTLHSRAASVDLVELDGRLIRPLDRLPAGGGETSVEISMPRFGIRTLRFSGLAAPVIEEGCCTR